MKVSAFDYELPPERIAARPAQPRDGARLLVMDGERPLADAIVSDLPDRLAPGDLLVVNDTKVIPARVFGRRATGGRVEFLLLRRDRALVKAHRRLRPGEQIEMDGGMRATLLEKEDAIWRLHIDSDEPLEQVLDRVGHVPLPPYIKRDDAREDREHYQTVFADQPGSAAAPTAGLHFTPDLLRRLEERGVELARVTLHVGYGTFQPVDTEEVEQHRLHEERFDVSEEAAKKIRERKGRLVAVGTTTTRVLETLARTGGIRAEAGTTDLFLYPGRRFRAVEGLLTNFHLPRSSLLMLVCALAGRERVLAAYAHAIESGYRFYSYGDAMLVLCG